VGLQGVDQQTEHPGSQGVTSCVNFIGGGIGAGVGIGAVSGRGCAKTNSQRLETIVEASLFGERIAQRHLLHGAVRGVGDR